MTTNLRICDRFPDDDLPSHEGKPLRLSQFTRPGLLDRKFGFHQFLHLSQEVSS